MPGYPCCCGGGGCSACDSNGTPDTLTIDVPEGIDDNCGDCTGFAGSYSVPKKTGTTCTWEAEFAITEPDYDVDLFGTCNETADTLLIRATILSGSVLKVTVTVKDATDIHNSYETYEFRKTLSNPENCCGWNLLAVNHHSTYQSGVHGDACDFTGTNLDVTASTAGC